MRKVHSLRRLQALLPAVVALFASMLIPEATVGQVGIDAQPPAPLSDTQFDDLNSRLGAVADRLLATPISTVAPRAQASSSVAASKLNPPAAPLATFPERRNKANSRVAQLRPIIDPILRKEGVPSELAAVVLIESGGQATALSPKGARGVWQLMPDTARRYGLVVSEQRDERLDLVSATQAAARYLHDLYSQFGNWELAIAAYNAGEQAVSTAIGRAGNNSFAVLSQLHLLPAETRKYVPAVLSASGPLERLPAVEIGSRSLSSGPVFFAVMAPDLQTFTHAAGSSIPAHP